MYERTYLWPSLPLQSVRVSRKRHPNRFVARPHTSNMLSPHTALPHQAPAPHRATPLPLRSESSPPNHTPAPRGPTPLPLRAAPTHSSSTPPHPTRALSHGIPYLLRATPFSSSSVPPHFAPSPRHPIPLPLRATPSRSRCAPPHPAPAPRTPSSSHSAPLTPLLFGIAPPSPHSVLPHLAQAPAPRCPIPLPLRAD
jgi:hypothetical protein